MSTENDNVDIDFEEMCDKHWLGFSNEATKKQRANATSALKEWIKKYKGEFDENGLSERLVAECKVAAWTHNIIGK